jgi:hypothetical protein
MSRHESLPVDIADPEDVRAQLPRARNILAEKEDRHHREAKDVETWRARVALFEQIAGAEDAPEVIEADTGDQEQVEPGTIVVDFTGTESVLDAAVRTVNEQNRAIRSREVADLLRATGEFEDLTNIVVSNALYYASERADPRRVRKLTKRGFYAPLLPPDPSGAPMGPDPTMRAATTTIQAA